ncbi:MAG TPA: hypothetical protein DCK95_08525 [Anaerolineaceae bacterium]|nr:hypothetical protein [Anaerolineaceae bacterium]
MVHKKLSYKWLIAFICFIMFFVILGLGNSTSNLYIVPVTEYFGFNRGDFSLTFTIITIIGMLIQLFFGYFLERWGIRSLVIGGAILAPIAYLLFYCANSLSMFYIGAVILGICFAFTSTTSISILINKWFDKDQGTLLGIISAGSGFGGALFTLIIGNQITQNGFKSAYLLSVWILLIAAIPVLLFVRSDPSDIEKKEREDRNSERIEHSTNTKTKISFKTFIGNPHNAIGILAVFLMGITIHPVLINTPAYLIEMGFDTEFATNVSSAIFFVLAFAKIILGIIHDKLGIKTSLYIGLISFVLCSVILLFSKAQWSIWIMTIFMGIAVSTLSVIVPLYVKALLGKNDYENFLGFFMAILSAGVAVGVPIINYAYDFSGNYSGIIGAYAVLGLLALVLAIFSLRKKQIQYTS